MFKLSVFWKRQKITIWEWTIFGRPIQCALGKFFCLMNENCNQINFFVQQLQKNGFLIALKLKLLVVSDFCTLWKLKTRNPNFVKRSKSLKCVYQNWRFLKTILMLNFAHVKPSQWRTKRLSFMSILWLGSHRRSQDFTSDEKRLISLLSQSFQTEIS